MDPNVPDPPSEQRAPEVSEVMDRAVQADHPQEASAQITGGLVETELRDAHETAISGEPTMRTYEPGE